jgi:hypothetical protein
MLTFYNISFALLLQIMFSAARVTSRVAARAVVSNSAFASVRQPVNVRYFAGAGVSLCELTNKDNAYTAPGSSHSNVSLYFP